jgi:hypothetical protein
MWKKSMRARMIAFYVIGAEYEYLENCPICGLDQFNHGKDGGDDKNYNRRKGGPKKSFCYFPIIPRLKR